MTFAGSMGRSIILYELKRAMNSLKWLTIGMLRVKRKNISLCSDFKFLRMVVLFGAKNPDLSAAIGSTQNSGSCHQLFKLKRQASSRSSTSLSKTFSPSHQTYPKCWWPLWWMICMCYICWVVNYRLMNKICLCGVSENMLRAAKIC